MTRPGALGAALVELVITVAIVGVLSAIAIPQLLRYIRRSKTSEAELNLRRLYDATVMYWAVDHTDAQGSVLPHQLPASESTTPPLGSCCVQPGGRCAPMASLWQTPTWNALHFSVDEPFYYQYAYESVGVGHGSQFTVRALGDLDCDGRFSTYERTGRVGPDGVVGAQGVSIVRELE